MSNLITCLIYDESIPQIKFAIDELKKYIPINQDEDFTLVVTTLNSNFMEDLKNVKPLDKLSASGYIIKRDDSIKRILVIGADYNGAMYGVLDIAHILKVDKDLDCIKDMVKNPYIENRGIKFNIPLDARTPSYSDSADSAISNIENMWNFDFWREFLDQMAYNKYNVLSLWNLHPFPSLVKVPEYPDVALEDVMKPKVPVEATLIGLNMCNEDVLNNLVFVKKISIDEKIVFWNNIMQYAKNRGIDIYIFTWNMFVFGTEHTNYGIKPSQTNDTTIDYFRKSIRTLFETYPLLKGIGVTAGENMDRTQEGDYSDENWMMKTYGEGIKDALKKDPSRKINFIHRAHYTSMSIIDKAFETYPLPFDYSFKYSQAHMYGAVKPNFGDEFFKQLPKDKRTWLTVRNDDFYMYRWGDPEFARDYIKNMPPKDKLAGFYMGPDGYTWGREYISTEPDDKRQQIINKMWLNFAIWGRLSYDPQIPDIEFKKLVGSRFTEVPLDTLYSGWTAASKIIPLVNRLHWHNLDFQWYPEACCCQALKQRPTGFHDIIDFMETPTAPGSDYISVSEYVKRVTDKRDLQGVTPIDVLKELQDYIVISLNSVEAMKEALPSCSKELRLTIGDIEAMALLGKYYCSKINSAIDLSFYLKTKEDHYKSTAIENIKDASKKWAMYAEKSRSLYNPQILTRMQRVIDVKELQALVDEDINIVNNTF